MGFFSSVDWDGVNWITPGIHLYAVVVLVLCATVYFLHRFRLEELARRLSNLCRQIEGTGETRTVSLDQMTSLMIHLGDTVERRTDLDSAPVLAFVRREEQQRSLAVVSTLVNLTETMIELFPMLGILGTVWGFAGVGSEDFSSERLLFLLATAMNTTLWALLYAIVFRIGYSAFVQSKVMSLLEYNQRFTDFLAILERRSNSSDFGMEGASHPWAEKSP